MSFQVVLKAGEKDADAALPSTIKLEFSAVPYTFSEKQWNAVKPDPATTETGRLMNLQKSLITLARSTEEE